MKARFIVKCKRGFVNAEWKNGKKYPECWGYSYFDAISYSEKRANALLDLLDNNILEPYLVQIL